jgi:hypothetical protein
METRRFGQMIIVKAPKRKRNHIHERFVADLYRRRKRLILDILRPDVWSRVAHPVSVQELKNHARASCDRIQEVHRAPDDLRSRFEMTDQNNETKNFLHKKRFFIQFEHATFKCKLTRQVPENSQEHEANVAVMATDASGV